MPSHFDTLCNGISQILNARKNSFGNSLNLLKNKASVIDHQVHLIHIRTEKTANISFMKMNNMKYSFTKTKSNKKKENNRKRNDQTHARNETSMSLLIIKHTDNYR